MRLWIRTVDGFVYCGATSQRGDDQHGQKAGAGKHLPGAGLGAAAPADGEAGGPGGLQDLRLHGPGTGRRHRARVRRYVPRQKPGE